jgi:hypothetical protein
MTNKKRKTRKFNGMSYREVQQANSKNRSELLKEDQKWLRDNGYKNVGWIKVINFYKKIDEFLDKYQLKDLTLEELFLEADRIGNKYLTNQEINEFNQKLSKEVNEIEEEVEKQFPDTEIEIIDFGDKTENTRKRHNRKLHRY